MITHPALIVIALVAIESLVLWLSRRERSRHLFKVLPAVFWIYFLPLLAANFGLLPAQSPVYGLITTYLLPASLVLLLLPVDLHAILRLGPRALAMYFIGAAGIVAGAVLAFALVRPLVGADFWSGFGALAGSWTGGSANMVAVKEALAVPEAIFAPMVIVDTVVPYLWMGLLIALVGLQGAFDRWNRAERAVLDDLGERAARHVADSGGRRAIGGIVLTLLVAAAVSGAAHLLARELPQIRDVVSTYTWTILLVTAAGLALSLSPARQLERAGATRTGYDLLYFVLTAIGAKAAVASLGSTLVLIGAGLLIVAVHAVFLLIGARLLRAPLFLAAAASQANLGGVASAPVVAEVYQPGLASVGLLLAILGNIAGTWLGIACAQLCRILPALLLTLLLAAPAAAAPGRLLIDDFEGGLGPQWTVKSFQGETAYRVIDTDGNRVLQADSHAAASGLVRKIDLDPHAYPILTWRWKVSGTIPQGDERTKSGDDYAARVYVIFPHWFFPKTRTLNYIWANHLPEGAFLPNAYTGNAVMIAVRSGPRQAGAWLAERRDIVADYRRAFGEEPPRLGAIAVMTDTDNTGATVSAWYDDLVLLER